PSNSRRGMFLSASPDDRQLLLRTLQIYFTAASISSSEYGTPGVRISAANHLLSENRPHRKVAAARRHAERGSLPTPTSLQHARYPGASQHRLQVQPLVVVRLVDQWAGRAKTRQISRR